MLLIRCYKKHKSNRDFWEYKIVYKDVFTNKMKQRRRRGFHTKAECEAAAAEMVGYLQR